MTAFDDLRRRVLALEHRRLDLDALPLADLSRWMEATATTTRDPYPQGTVSPDWLPLALLNGWHNADTATTTLASCRLAAPGLIAIRGLVNDGNTNTICATLPENLRPAQERWVPTYLQANAGAIFPGMLRVAVNGDITPGTWGIPAVPPPPTPANPIALASLECVFAR